MPSFYYNPIHRYPPCANFPRFQQIRTLLGRCRSLRRDFRSAGFFFFQTGCTNIILRKIHMVMSYDVFGHEKYEISWNYIMYDGDVTMVSYELELFGIHPRMPIHNLGFVESPTSPRTSRDPTVGGQGSLVKWWASSATPFRSLWLLGFGRRPRKKLDIF